MTAAPAALVLQVDVTRYELGKGVGDRNDWLLKILGLHSGGDDQRTGGGQRNAKGGEGGEHGVLFTGSYVHLFSFVELADLVSEAFRM